MIPIAPSHWQHGTKSWYLKTPVTRLREMKQLRQVSQLPPSRVYTTFPLYSQQILKELTDPLPISKQGVLVSEAPPSTTSIPPQRGWNTKNHSYTRRFYKHQETSRNKIFCIIFGRCSWARQANRRATSSLIKGQDLPAITPAAAYNSALSLLAKVQEPAIFHPQVCLEDN